MDKLAITPKGFRLMIAGAVTMAAGFILMIGGGSSDPQVFNYAMFNFTRTVAAPVVIVAGVVVVAIGIMGGLSLGKKKAE